VIHHVVIELPGLDSCLLANLMSLQTLEDIISVSQLAERLRLSTGLHVIGL
jgi:hypothetical protein